MDHPTPERPSITDLLRTHKVLLLEHIPKLSQLLRDFVEEEVDPKTLGGIITDTRGMFGAVALDAADGGLATLEGAHVLVVVIGIDGLVTILGAIVPEALAPTLERAPGWMPILVVDRDDEPALHIVLVDELLLGAS